MLASSQAMRSRALFVGFVALNAVFAAALIYFVTRSGPSAPPLPPPTLATAASPQPAATSHPAETNQTASPRPGIESTNAANHPGVPPGKTFGWKDVESKAYLGYLDALRAAGCPEKMIRQIIFNDCNDLFNQRRLDAAIQHDFKWWQMDPQLNAGGYNPEYQSKMQNLVAERREILSRLLGDNWEAEDKSPPLADHTVSLTGPVLGSMSPDLYMMVQEICGRSVTRLQEYRLARFNEGLGTSEIELAKLRDQTRKDLSVVLNAEQLEEFLLRFSHNASQLRTTLRGVGLTPDEFRKVFRATDVIDHQVQMEFGGEEALSPKQREQTLRQKEQAVASVLGQDKYARMILSRDPLYRKAQDLVMDSGADESMTRAVFDVLRSSELQRQQVKANNRLTTEEKEEALMRINQDQRQQQNKLLLKKPQ